VPSGGLGRGGHAGGHGLRDAEEQLQPVAEHLLRYQVGLAEDADHGGVRRVGPEELPDPLAQHGQPGLVAGDHGKVPGHDLHVVQGVLQQRLEQVFLVGEVQVERAVRDAGPADHVVDAHAVKTPVLELEHARLEQPADGLAALGAQLAVLGRSAAAQRWSGRLFLRWPPGPAGRGVGRAVACLLVHSKSVAFRVVTALHSVPNDGAANLPAVSRQAVLSQRALNRALLSRQLLLDRVELPDEAGRRRAAVIAAIEHLVGLQAQAPFPPYYGLWSRLGGFRPDDLAAALTHPGGGR
jgi:hypothetical protein